MFMIRFESYMHKGASKSPYSCLLYTSVTTKDFNTFSETKLFFNPDFSVIDAAIVRDPVMKDFGP